MLRSIFAILVTLFATISLALAQCPADEIWHTTTDNRDISIGKFKDVKSHTYVNNIKTPEATPIYVPKEAVKLYKSTNG